MKRILLLWLLLEALLGLWLTTPLQAQYSRAWSETTPADTDLANTLGTAIRNLRTDIRQRLSDNITDFSNGNLVFQSQIAGLPSLTLFPALTATAGGYPLQIKNTAGVVVSFFDINGNLNVNGATSGTVTVVAPAVAGTTTLTWPSSTGTLATTANTATVTLNNLTTTSINADLLPSAAGARNLGSASLPFITLYFSGSSLTPAANNFTITGAATAIRTWTFQDASDTLVGRATTDTLTNKTISSPTITGTVAGAASYITPLLKGTTDQNIKVGPTVSIPGSVSLSSLNDAGALNIPLEVRYANNIVFFDAGIEKFRINNGNAMLTGSGANILVVGLNGVTNPAFNVDTSTALSATGLNIKSAAAASGIAVSVLSSAANENLTITAKGTGTASVNTAIFSSTGALTTENSLAPTGTGALVRATSPTIATPTITGALGGNLDLGTLFSSLKEIANASVTGTTVNTLAKLTGAPSTAVITATTDTSGSIGVVVAGAGTTGNAQVAQSGTASCVFDGATTAGNYVQISSTVAGNCHDAGSSYPTAGQVIGRVLSTNASGGTYSLWVFQPEIKGVASSQLRSYLSADISTTSSLAINTGISFTLSASTTYTLFCSLVYQSSATGAALKIDFSGPAIPNALMFNLWESTAAASTTIAPYRDTVTLYANSIGSSGVSQVTQNLSALITGAIENGVNSGTLNLRYLSSDGVSTITLKRGSYCLLQ